MDTIETLNLLIKTCRDGQQGFRLCAAELRSAELQALMNQRADDCARGTEELKRLVLHHGGMPDDATSVAGDVHRGWVIVRATLAGQTDEAILAECERGEDIALRDYRLALEQPLPEDVRQVIAHQLDGVQRNHDQVKALRDQASGERGSAALPTVPGRGRREAAEAGRMEHGGKLVQWSLAQARLHPVRAASVVALLGLVGWRALKPRMGLTIWRRARGRAGARRPG